MAAGHAGVEGLPVGADGVIGSTHCGEDLLGEVVLVRRPGSSLAHDVALAQRVEEGGHLQIALFVVGVLLHVAVHADRPGRSHAHTSTRRAHAERGSATLLSRAE